MATFIPLHNLERIGGALAHGTFDLFHVGHLHYLRQARTYGPLTVTLTEGEYIRNHGPGRPVFTDMERVEMIEALDFVSWVALVPDATAIPAIKIVRPQFYCKGAETRREGNETLLAEMAAVKACRGQTIFIPKKLPYSSGKLLSGEILKQRLLREMAKS